MQIPLSTPGLNVAVEERAVRPSFDFDIDCLRAPFWPSATLSLGVRRGDVDAKLKVITAAWWLLAGVKYSVNSNTYQAVRSYTGMGQHVCG